MIDRLKRIPGVVAEQGLEVLRWCVLAVLIGAAVALAMFVLVAETGYLWGLVQAVGPWGPYVCPLLAAAIVGVTAYRLWPASRGAGMPDYVYAVNTRQGYVHRWMILGKLFASVLTLGSGLVGGFIGPGAVIGGGLGAQIGRRLRWLFPRTFHRRRDVRLATVCGCAAAVCALLNAPIGAAIFAVEVLFVASIHYEYFFPAAMASAVAYGVTRLLPVLPDLVQAPVLTLTWPAFWVVLATTAVVTLVGLWFVWLYQSVHARAVRWRRPRWLGPLLGATAGVAVVFLAARCCGPEAGERLRPTALVLGWLTDPAAPALAAVAVLALGKALAAAFVVGSGNSGGLTGPTIVIGAAGGVLVAGLLGAVDPAIRSAACAAGIAAALAAVLNVPIAACVIVTEIFGISYAVPALIGSVIAYKTAKPVFLYEHVIADPRSRFSRRRRRRGG